MRSSCGAPNRGQVLGPVTPAQLQQPPGRIMRSTLFAIAALWNCRGYTGGTDRESFFLSFGESADALTVQRVLMAVSELARGKSMSSVPIPGGRRSKRIATKSAPA